MSPTTTFKMTVSVVLVLVITLWMTTTSRSSPVPEASPPELSEDAVNMNVSNLGEALFLLTGVFISAVQPQPSPKVALQLIMPKITSKLALGNFTRIFQHENRTRTPSSMEVTSVMTWTTTEIPGPGDILRVLCNDTFKHNVVTVLHINNRKVSRNFTDVSPYLMRLMDSIGMPVISWDSDFSTASQMDRSLQLAPTLYHQTEAMLAFMKRFSWKYFTMVTTQVTGHEDFFSSLRAQERESRKGSLPNKYGHVGFEYKILSDVILKSAVNREQMKLQLYEEVDPDTRIFLLHASPSEAKDILDVAKSMGWTSKGYVWILSATALGDRSEGESANAYPLGTFAVTYDSTVSHMQAVITRGVKVWLQAMVDMDRAGQVNNWLWDTKLACQGPQLKKWTGGQMLFDYLRNVSLPGTNDEVATDFNETGMVRFNKVYILNVMREVSRGSGASRLPKWGQGSHRGYRSLKTASLVSDTSNVLQSSSGSGRRRKRSAFVGGKGVPHRITASDSESVRRQVNSYLVEGRTGDSSRSKASDLPKHDFKLSDGVTDDERDIGIHKGSRLPQGLTHFKRSSTTNRNGKFIPRRNLTPSQPLDRFMSAVLHASTSRISQSSASSKSRNSVHLRQKVWGFTEDLVHKNSRLRKDTDVSISEESTVRKASSIMPGRKGILNDSMDSKSVRNTVKDLQSSSDSKDERTAADADDMKQRDRSQRLQSSQRRDAIRQLLRHRRQTRDVSFKQKFQKVATWDGKELTVMQIMWPGNSSFPPKGVPERYHLDVVTYVEEPHVTSKRMGETGKCDLHASPCVVYPRDGKDNRRPGFPKEKRCCSGLSIDILDRISKDLNFNYSLYEVESNGYGSVIENTNNTEWSGLMGAIMEGKADVAMAALSITQEREMVIDFSIPFLETGITIVVAIREGAISPTAFLEPYDYPSWTLILVFSVHATGASIFIFEWLSPYGLDQGHTPLRVHKFSLFRSFWLIWAMLFGAAVSTDVPRGVSSRFLANIWALFAVVFLASYTANLAAFMITKEEYYDLSGIQDWRLKNPHHRHPPFKYATMPKGATETNIRNNHKDLYDHMKKYPQHSVKEAVDSLKEQRIQAFIYDATTLEYAVGRDVGCKLKSVGKRYAETGYGVGFPKRSRWRIKFNEVLLRMQDEGEIERLQKFWLAGACHKKRQQRGSSSHTLGILNFTSAFILLGGGVVLGGLLLMLEHIYFRFGRKSLKKWDRCGCCSLVSLSMGKSLTFEQSVMEAIDFQKNHKCRDPLCETQLWKAKHELDIALLRIDQLQRQLAKQGPPEAEPAMESPSEPTYEQGESARHKDGILRKRVFQSSPHPIARRTRVPSISSNADSVESLGGPTTPTRHSSRERSGVLHSPRSRNVSESSPSRTSGRRTRVSDGKIYENVGGGGGGMDLESTI